MPEFWNAKYVRMLGCEEVLISCCLNSLILYIKKLRSQERKMTYPKVAWLIQLMPKEIIESSGLPCGRPLQQERVIYHRPCLKLIVQSECKKKNNFSPAFFFFFFNFLAQKNTLLLPRSKAACLQGHSSLDPSLLKSYFYSVLIKSGTLIISHSLSSF